LLYGLPSWLLVRSKVLGYRVVDSQHKICYILVREKCKSIKEVQ
jgi:hypothetical protein